MKKIAINGFGRIGRMVFRQLFEDKNLEIVAINDLTSTKVLAHLLKYDTAHSKFPHSVDFTKEHIVVKGQKIRVYAERDPENLPWKKLEIDGVVESTGFFVTLEGSQKHIKAGAKKVVISAPAKGSAVKTVVYSVNHDIIKADDQVISAASCTTNALAPLANAIHKEFGIVKGLMTTVHAYTADQRIQDAPHADLRRARAAAQNIVPTSTGAAAAIGLVIPSLNKKLDGKAMRVPVITGSIIDLVVELDKNPTVEEINAGVQKYQSDSFAYLTDPVVSSDVIGATHGSLFDSLLTSKITDAKGKNLYKLITWYDNENSYVSQFVRTFNYFINLD